MRNLLGLLSRIGEEVPQELREEEWEKGLLIPSSRSIIIEVMIVESRGFQYSQTLEFNLIYSRNYRG